MMKKSLLSLLTATLLISGSATVLSANQKAKAAKAAKPFLIQGKLPHLTMQVKILWNDADLALTAEQKKELLVVRKHTLSRAKKLKLQIIKLEDKVVKASQDGLNPRQMKKDVDTIAKLRAEATMVHLECIYKTRKILSEDQLYILE
jgi:hypothetical protein